MGEIEASRNVELVRRGFRLFDDARFDDWVAMFTDDAEIPALALVGSEQVYRGTEGLRRWLAELRATGTHVRSFDDEYHEVGDGRVVVLGRVVVESAAERGFGSVAGWVYALRGDKVARVDVYPHPNLALEAVGLEPTEADA
jgi:ketosteroid isomerase-like protein